VKIKSTHSRGIRAIVVTTTMIALTGPTTSAQGQEDVEALKRQLEEAQQMIP
jgi:hypothetical protein